MRSSLDQSALILSQSWQEVPFAESAMLERIAWLFGRAAKWQQSLVGRIAQQFSGRRPTATELHAFLLSDRGFQRALRNPRTGIVLEHLPRPVMKPVPALAQYSLPQWQTPGDLADWLGIHCRQLYGVALASTFRQASPAQRHHHYRYRWIGKGAGRLRLIEAPKHRLKLLQRRILVELLNLIPCHAAAHGFCPGRNTRSFAAPHVGKPMVMRLDLADFFPSVRRAQVQAIFKTCGYPNEVARLLTGLCTNAAPGPILEQIVMPRDPLEALRIRDRYGGHHLPQGAPTSPALANLAAFRLDARLRGLAQAAGAQYTRYADDLAFSGSGSFARSAKRFYVSVLATITDEGFRLNYEKTRFMRASQRQVLAGIVVNQHINIDRREYDRLKALLHNCWRYGPSTQQSNPASEFRAELTGRVAYLASLHPQRGKRLQTLLDRIDWSR